MGSEIKEGPSGMSLGHYLLALKKVDETQKEYCEGYNRVW